MKIELLGFLIQILLVGIDVALYYFGLIEIVNVYLGQARRVEEDVTGTVLGFQAGFESGGESGLLWVRELLGEG